MVGAAIRYLIMGYGDDGHNPQYQVYDFVGDNVFPNVLPQNYGLPAIVYTIRNIEPSNIKSFRAIAKTIEVEIDIVAESYAKVSQISTLVANNLHRYKNIYNSASDAVIGYGTKIQSGYGNYAPACTGQIQYVAGLQIIDLFFTDASESFDDILENYRNTLTFKITYVNDATIWGADIMLKLEDKNLMATTSSGGNPKYDQPIEVDDGVNYLWFPSIYSDTDNVEYTIAAYSVNNEYPVFYDTSGTSNTHRPLLKQSALNPPKFNKLNYLQFGENKYLTAVNTNLAFNRKYKEMTFFCVLTLPDSYSPNDKSAAILFKRSTTSTASGGVGVKSVADGDNTAFKFLGMALEDDGSGGETHKGFDIASIASTTLVYPDLRFSEPVFFAFSVSRETTTKLSGEIDLIVSSYIDTNLQGEDGRFDTWEATASSTWMEYFFNFETLHSDITGFNTNGAGTIDLNDELHLYDLIIYPEKLTFGSAKYDEIKNSILAKHRMVNTFKIN